MRLSSSLVVAVALASLSASAGAQRGEPASGCGFSLTNSCQATVDLFDYVAPQLAALVSAGNPTLGQGGALNGFRHFAVTLRARALHGSLPDLRGFAPGFSGGRERFPTK